LKFFNPNLVATSVFDGIDSANNSHPSKAFIPGDPDCPWTYEVYNDAISSSSPGWRFERTPFYSLLNSGGTYGVYVGFNWVYQYSWTGVKDDWGTNPKKIIGYISSGMTEEEAPYIEDAIVIPIRASIISYTSLSMSTSDWVLQNRDSQWLMRGKGIISNVNTVGFSSFYFVPTNTSSSRNYGLVLTTSDGSDAGFSPGSEFTFTMDYMLIPRKIIPVV
jgi:hypothetical protein